jgi:dTDP-4-amino-4,6-dideoxygalactose transaminase
MKNWVHLKPINTTRVNQLLTDCIQTNIYTNGGKNVRRLEETTRRMLKIDDSKDVICVANATMAIYALCNGIEFTNNHPIQWATQSFTFPSSAQGMLKDAYIVDIDMGGGIDLTKIPSDVGGIIVTNIFGNIVDIDKYVSWATENNKYLIFDNAATAYTFYKGKNSCNYGHGSIISFHHTKPLGFGEGGAIIVDRKYSENIRRLINFGIHNEKMLPWNRLGANYKMSEISAVYILQYLEDHFDKIVAHHTELYRACKGKYSLYPNYADEDMPIIVSCICLLDDQFTNEYIDKLIQSGVMCRKYYHPLVHTDIAEYYYNKILCYPCNLDIKDIVL